jgi:hypothetical protein
VFCSPRAGAQSNARSYGFRDRAVYPKRRLRQTDSYQ